MKQTYSYGAATLQGDWPVQEDGFYADPVAGVFILADGFGGKGGGDLAVKLVLQEAKIKSWQSSDVSITTQKKFIQDSNEKVVQWNAKRGAAPKGGCSLLLAQVDQSKNLTISNSGASAAALWRSGKLFTLLSPQANPRDYMGMPQFPYEALGMGSEVGVETRTFPLLAGDVVLMASSGMQWDSDDFATQFSAKMAVRFPGENLAPMTQELVEIFGGIPGQSWNRSLILFEA